MRRTVSPVLLGILGTLALPLTVAGCESIIDQRGFAATPGSTEKLEIGTQSREDVVRLIGSPSTVATFNPNVWYYIAQKQEYYAFFKPSMLQQDIIQLTFNDSGRLETIKKYELADSREIDMVSRITPTAGKEMTILEQLLGNVGRFSGPRQETNPGAPTGAGI